MERDRWYFNTYNNYLARWTHTSNLPLASRLARPRPDAVADAIAAMAHQKKKKQKPQLTLGAQLPRPTPAQSAALYVRKPSGNASSADGAPASHSATTPA